MSPTIADLLALVDAGDGFAVFTDPETKRELELRDRNRFRLPVVPETDEELRAMLDEARKDFDEGKVVHRTTEEFLAEARRRAGLG
jgi:hypothetical protein